MSSAKSEIENEYTWEIDNHPLVVSHLLEELTKGRAQCNIITQVYDHSVRGRSRLNLGSSEQKYFLTYKIPCPESNADFEAEIEISSAFYSRMKSITDIGLSKLRFEIEDPGSSHPWEVDVILDAEARIHIIRVEKECAINETRPDQSTLPPFLKGARPVEKGSFLPNIKLSLQLRSYKLSMEQILKVTQSTQST